MTHTNTLDLTADIIDTRDIIERIEELENLIENEGCEDTCTEYREELTLLSSLMEEMKGNGGDEQWRGDWYPITLIRETYFTDYIQELIHDCYEMPKEMHSGSWPYRHMSIDYEAAADEAKGDYCELEIDGVTYFYR
jgi:hypothetical protein